MHHETTPLSARKALDSLAQRAIAGGTPRAVAIEAVRATDARFPRRARTPRARLESYFWGVVRRRALQGAAPIVSRNMVIASLVHELREAGHTAESIRDELTRLYGEAARFAIAS